MFKKLNTKIVESPMWIWAWALVIYIVCALVAMMLPESISFNTLFFFIVVFWAVNIYICYVAARNQNRAALLWALLGAWLFVIPVVILDYKARNAKMFPTKLG